MEGEEEKEGRHYSHMHQTVTLGKGDNTRQMRRKQYDMFAILHGQRLQSGDAAHIVQVFISAVQHCGGLVTVATYVTVLFNASMLALFINL